MSNKSATDVIAVPKGGGALKGIGEKFTPDLFTGTGNYSVPIELPPGRNGFQPQLSLVYSTGNGNSPFGLGWSLSVPGVTRKTSKGVPLYDDERDVFILSGFEDLVPISRDATTARYRPRTETSFARIDHNHDGAAGNDYWEVRSRDGTVSLYGTPRPGDASGAWVDPAVVADPDNPRRRYAWKLTETRDPFGNCVQFLYARDPVREDGPHRWDQVYLSEIRYVDYGSAESPSFLVQIKFHYEARPDPFSECRAGFEIRTVKRCKRIEVWTNAGQARRVRTYHLKYLDELVVAKEELPHNGASLLAQLEVEGHDTAAGRSQKLPPLRPSYGRFEPEKRKFGPVAGAELPPASLANEDYELVDLFGNGLPDILEMSTAQVRYWRNLGGGAFDRPRSMRDAPAGLSLGDPGVQLIDADGEGRADLVVTQPRLSGYFPLTFQGGWDRRSFRPWDVAPSVNLEDPEVKLLDLDGDGVTDALRLGTSFECYFNHPKTGWHATRRVERRSLEEFPNVNLSDPRVKWGDMNGDGLTDIVLVHEGRVDYWPSLGRGDFAPRITMQNAPQFPYGYDPRRILVGDVDGDGVADLVYIDHQKVILWINRSGNSWSDPIEILGTPAVTDMDSVRLVDLLGTGVPGVLWSRDATALPRERMFFLDLTGGHKPYLLEHIDNNMGAITNIAYAPSTRFYLEDLGTPRQWRTPLPFPVQVVARVESIDQVSGGKLTSEYSYHHGYWDGAEREFRGFGRVDHRDTEVFEHYHAPGIDSEGRPFNQVELRHFAPPMETRTWFHLGPVGEEFSDWGEIDCSGEFWSGDAQTFERSREVSTALQALPRRGQRAALRALRGRTLRIELYANDGSSRGSRPYTVTERLHEVRIEVPPASDGSSPGVFFPYQAAERTTQWERGDDPMTQFIFTGDYDSYGQPGSELRVAVPRGRDYRRPANGSAESFLVTQTLTEYARPDDGNVYIVNRIAHRTIHEILDDGRGNSDDPRPSVLELWNRVEMKLLLKSQIIGETLNYYDGNDFEGLDLGRVGSRGALTRVEQLVLTKELLRSGYGGDASGAASTEQPPYLNEGGTVSWSTEYPLEFQNRISKLVGSPPRGRGILGGYVLYPGDAVRGPGYFAVTTQRAYNRRGLVTAERDALGNETQIEYGDTYELLPTKVTGPTQLETMVAYDYRVLQPQSLTDPNGNETAYRYTPLGLLEAVTVIGKAGYNEGDTPDKPSTRFEYNHQAFIAEGQPVYTHTTRRVHHTNETDVSVPVRDKVIEVREYSDGFGRLLQSRRLAEDVLFGTAEFGSGVLPVDGAESADAVGTVRSLNDPVNVVVTGWRTYDNKGRAVEEYEPFFSTGWHFVPPTDSQRGQKATLFYEPRGRVVRIENPDGSQQLTVHGIPRDIRKPEDFAPSPWESFSYDANDNAERTAGVDANAGAYPGHKNTPSSTLVDALGRTIKEVERNGPDPTTDWYERRHEYDIRGNVLAVWDELGRPAFRHVYDLADRPLRTEQLDTGARRTIFDAAGNIVEQRDGKGGLVLHARDALRRPTHLWARDESGHSVTLREHIVYGDSPSAGLSRTQAKSKNILGKAYQHYDEVGLLQFEEYDFKGNLIEKTRQVIADTQILSVFVDAAANDWRVDAFRVNWQPPGGTSVDNHADSLLDRTATYRTSQRYDALNRLKWLEYPADVNGARARLQPTYNGAGALERVRIDGQTLVDHIAYNARGQRTLVAYGDRDSRRPGPRVMTRYAYDPKTFRLESLRTETFTSPSPVTYRPAGRILQNIAYKYDLVGNLEAMHDRTPGSGLPDQPDRLDRVFTYDPLYRLVSATGRECDAPLPTVWEATPRCHDQMKTRAYEQRYRYDPAGNLTRIDHKLAGVPGGALSARNLNLASGTNRLATMTEGSASHQYTYDTAGNIRRENAERHFEWDHSNRMRVFRVQPDGAPPSKHAQYSYDSSGQRVKKIVRKNGRVEVTVYIDGVFEHHYVVDGVITRASSTLHILDNQRRIATIRRGADLDDATPALKFYCADHLGSSVIALDHSGDWVSREEYTPYGETSFGSFVRKRYRFAGKERDEESGLCYFVARYYAPWLGRWMSPDPAGPVDGLNLQAYGRGNPLRYRDPDGTQAREAEGSAKSSSVTDASTRGEEGPSAATREARGRLFFAIAYQSQKVQDAAFLRAAITYERELKSSGAFNKETDAFLLKEVATVEELLAAWAEIALASTQKPVAEGQYFGHATRHGLELFGKTFRTQQIKELDKVTWAEGASLRLTGCRTALGGSGGRPSVAEVFAVTQGVRTRGETGKAEFSWSPEVFWPTPERVDISRPGWMTKPLYLNAFDRGQNEALIEFLFSNTYSHQQGIGAKPLPDRYFLPTGESGIVTGR